MATPRLCAVTEGEISELSGEVSRCWNESLGMTSRLVLHLMSWAAIHDEVSTKQGWRGWVECHLHSIDMKTLVRIWLHQENELLMGSAVLLQGKHNGVWTHCRGSIYTQNEWWKKFGTSRLDWWQILSCCQWFAQVEQNSQLGQDTLAQKLQHNTAIKSQSPACDS